MSDLPSPNPPDPGHPAEERATRPNGATAEPANSDRTGPEPVATVRGRRAYAPPARLGPIDHDLAGNEGAEPDPALFDALRHAGPDVLRKYPKTTRRALTEKLANIWSIDPTRVLVTAGADETIDRVCRAYLDPTREVVLPVPTFEMFEPYIGLTGARCVPIPWTGVDLPVDAMCAAVTPNTGMIVVVSPNNPNGRTATADDLRRLSKAAPHTILLVDAAYAEFTDEDISQAALALPNAVVCRSLSKAWGLAGLRIGYALGNADHIAALEVAGGPFSVAGPSMAMALAALSTSPANRDAYVARVRDERRVLEDTAQRLGLQPTRSAGNFVLLRTADPEFLRDGMHGLGIAVRIWPGRAWLDDAVRIACPGDAAALNRVVRGLEAIVAPQRLILDVDAARRCESVRAELAGYVEIHTLDRARESRIDQSFPDGSDGTPTWAVCDDVAAIEAARHTGAIPFALAGPPTARDLDRATSAPAGTAPRDPRITAGIARLLPDSSALVDLLRRRRLDATPDSPRPR